LTCVVVLKTLWHYRASVWSYEWIYTELVLQIACQNCSSTRPIVYCHKDVGQWTYMV